ncbi:MAG TPA: hypothetical protein VH083_19435 [Myxococcales bacterium]|nr:hypothetical protein [Myxococcales bacterium]
MKWLCLLCLAACTPKPPPPGAAGPSEAVEEFGRAIQRGDSAGAWALLSTRTQEQANRMAAVARPDAGDGRSMLFAGAIPGGDVKVTQVQSAADSAEVQTALPDGGPGQTFHVVREGDRFRVDLDLGR